MRPLVERSLWRALAAAFSGHLLFLGLAAASLDPAALRGISLDRAEPDRFLGGCGFVIRRSCPRPIVRFGAMESVAHPWSLPVVAPPPGPLDHFIYRHLNLEPEEQRRSCWD